MSTTKGNVATTSERGTEATPDDTPQAALAGEKSAKKARSDGAPGGDENAKFAVAMRELIGERWATVWKTVPVALAGEDIEGVHDVRVASRRLRAAMDVAVECFPGSWYRPLHKTAKAITGALGEVRDRDVLIEALTAQREAAAAAEQPGIDRLIARVDRERTAARAAMESFLRGLLDSETPAETARRFGAAERPLGAGR